MKLRSRLTREQTQASIQSRELSDPHAYSMSFPDVDVPSLGDEHRDREDNDLWPLRSSSNMPPYPTDGRPRNYSVPRAPRSSMVSFPRRSAVDFPPWLLSNLRSSFRQFSYTPPDEAVNRLSFQKGTSVEDDESESVDDAHYVLDPPSRSGRALGELTALPTMQPNSNPAKAMFFRLRTMVRKLQEVPAQPHSADAVRERTRTGRDDIEGQPVLVFTPGKGVYMAFTTLAILTIMVALDSTALSVALPVSLLSRVLLSPGTCRPATDISEGDR